MKISIKNRYGQITELEVNANDTIKDLKSKIFGLKTTPVDQQRLIFDCMVLKDGKTLKDYFIQDGSTILFFEKENSLLLPSSTIFSGSSLIDRIHQTDLDLISSHEKEEVINLIIEAISYLDEALDYNTLNELLNLISSCINYYPAESYQTFQIRYQKPNITFLHILLLVSMTSNLFGTSKIPEESYSDIISNTIKEIIPQIQSNIDPIKIKGFVVIPQYKTKFINSLINSTKLTEQLVTLFYPYFFKPDTESMEFDRFIQKVCSQNLIQLIPEELYLQDHILFQMSHDNLSTLCTKISEKNFKKILPTIEDRIIEKFDIEAGFSNKILNRCIELDMKIRTFTILFNYYDDFLSVKIWEYLFRNKYRIDDELSAKIQSLPCFSNGSFPKTPLLMKVFSHPESLPPEIVTYSFLNADNFEFYIDFLDSKFDKCEVVSTFEFWDHITSIDYTDDEPLEYTTKIFASCFVRVIRPQKINEFFEKLIFNNFPPPQKKSHFLFKFLEKLPQEYIDEYHSDSNDFFMMKKLLEHKEVPSPSCCKLFNFRFLDPTLKKTPLILYELAASGSLITSTEILPMTHEPNDNLIKFIQQDNDFDLITKIDEESFSLISSAFIFSKIKQVQINGLTEENTLPFYAILLNFEGNCSKMSPKQMLELLIHSCKYFCKNQTPFLIECVNSILLKMRSLLDPQNFPALTLFHCIDILCDLLLNGDYKADKNILILAIFEISCYNFTSSLFKKHGNNLFQYIINNIPEINKNKLFSKSFLNLRSFEKLGTVRKFVEIIQNSTSYDPIFQLIYFLTNHCKNAPIIMLDNESNLNTALRKSIYEENWDDVLVIIEFMKSNYKKIDINFFNNKKIPLPIVKLLSDKVKMNNIDDIITFALADPEIETNETLLKSLFNTLMMINTSTSVRYNLIFLEKITLRQILLPEKLLTNLYQLYKTQNSAFIYAIKHYYSFSSEKQLFIRKISPGDIKLVDPNFQFLIRLIERKSYQSFVCLQNIASAFPFFFEPFPNEVDSSHSLVAVNIVLPELNHISKLFDEDNSDEKISSIKTSIAALYFLFSCLYSTRFISIFVLWIFENLTKLTDSQVFCLTHILLSLFKSDIISKIVFAYAYKYNFFDIITNLLSREIKNETFKYYYKQNLFELLNVYFRYFSNINSSGDAAFIGCIKNDKIKNPFQNRFNSFTTVITTKIRQMTFNLPPENNALKSFISNLNRAQSFWITAENQYKYNLNTSKVSSWANPFDSNQDLSKEMPKFLSIFKNDKLVLINDPLPKIPTNITSEMHGYLMSYPSWAVDFIENTYSNSYYPSYISSEINNAQIVSKINEYRAILISAIASVSRFPQATKQNQMNNNSFTKSIKPYEHFSSHISNVSLFNELLKESINCADISKNNFLIEIINKILQQNQQFIPNFLKFMSDLISQAKISSQLLIRVCQVINSIWKNKKETDKLLLDQCGNNLIDFALSSCNQNNGMLLEHIAQLLSSLKCEIPIRVTHLIGTIFAFHPNLINYAIELYFKIGDKDSANITSIIQRRYSQDVEQKNPNFAQIRFYVDNFPTLAKNCISTTSILLEKVIDRYKNSDYRNYELRVMIIELFNMVAPDYQQQQQQQNNGNKIIENNQNDEMLYPVPDYIKQTSPFFWENFYEKNRLFLCEMIKKNSSVFDDLYFLFNYTELLSFKLRFMCFQRNLGDLIDPYDYLCIRVSRSRILLDTFGYWCRKEKSDFLGSFNIEFTQEDGSDQGGLTREWFTYLIKEILDPKLGLFIKSENHSYHFNPSACLNCLNIECLKMAGGILALSLIRETNINAHFSRFLLRQLLHQEIQLEDVEDFDESLFISFKSILESKDVKPLDLVFSVNEFKDGKVVSVNLIENGDKIEVTNENKNEYVKSYIDYKLKNSVLEQTKAFCEGFESFIDYKYIKMFTPKELDMIICGNKTIDIEDMKKHTHYGGAYHQEHPVIVMFFNVISKWSQETLSKFIQFLTGSSQIGVNGFISLTENGSPLTIYSSGSKDHLPVAHTCCNQLDLPEYDNETDMNNKLLMAIEETRFGIA